MNKNAIERIELFAVERDIHKISPEPINYATNVLEELLEHLGYSVSKENRKALRSSFKSFMGVLNKNGIAEPAGTQEHDKIDAIADVIVFSMTELMKYGYDIEKVLAETSKEILSRTGSIVDGKFQKDLSKEAKALWYKANYDECKKKDSK